MELGQAVNRPSPIPAHVTFCVQTVYVPELAKHAKQVLLNDSLANQVKEEA